MAPKEFAVFKDKEMRKYLNTLEKRLKFKKDTAKEVVGILAAGVFRDIMLHFSDQKGPDGPWEKLNTKYLEKRTKRFGVRRKLQISGALRGSLKPLEKKENWRQTRAGILWFTDAKTKSGFPYAKAHDEGGKKSGRPPQRSFMWLSAQRLNLIEKIMVRYLESD